MPLEVEVTEKNSRGGSRAQAKDISEIGVRYAESGLAPRAGGDEVMLQFHLPGDPEPIEVEGIIADERCLASWSETRVTFAWPRVHDARRIREYIASHESPPSSTKSGSPR